MPIFLRGGGVQFSIQNGPGPTQFQLFFFMFGIFLILQHPLNIAKFSSITGKLSIVYLFRRLQEPSFVA